MKCVVAKTWDIPENLKSSIHLDRTKQFVNRLQWDLCVHPNGYEIDEYDDKHSEYLVISRNNQHLGSCRVRPTIYSTMIVDYFLNIFPDAKDFIKYQKGSIYELTRFCRSPTISITESKSMLGSLAVMLDQFRDSRNLTGFIAIVFPQVARFLDSLGVRYLIVSKSQLSGKSVLMICITHAVSVGAISTKNAIVQTGADTPRKQAA